MTQQTNGYVSLFRTAVLVATLSIGISCSNSAKPPQTDTSTGPTSKLAATAKCDEIDISVVASPTCSLTKARYDEITWENNHGTQALYTCIDPTNNPFEAYAWYVPPGAYVKTGTVKLEIQASNTPYDFFTSVNPCTVPPALAAHGVTSTPHVIIQ